MDARQVLLDLADRCEAEEPSREIDAAIASAVGWSDVRLEYVSSFTQDWHGVAVGETEGVDLVPLWTTSLDAAVTLYKVKPDRIPSDPKKVCAEALRQWT